MKLKEKLAAVKLRRKGLSYGEIRRKISVSRSTLSHWLREVYLKPNQQNRLRERMDRVRYAVAKRKVANRIKETRKIVERSIKEVAVLRKNPLFFVGLSLYWAEGAKSDEESVKLVNSDEKVIALSMRWFREICEVPESKFRIHVHVHDLHHRSNIIKYWSRITGVKPDQFYKPYVKHTSLGQRRNILYNGTCSIIVHDKALFRRIVGWKLGLQDFFNISPRSSTDRTKGF